MLNFGFFLWIALREGILLFSSVLLILTDHAGWAAAFLLIFMVILAQSIKTTNTVDRRLEK